MANAITIGRVGLLFVVVYLTYVGDTALILTAMGLLILVIVADGLDGWVARRRHETSTFGAVFDIAGDRIVENVLWIAFAHLGLIPVWVPLLVITRGFIVDALRSLALQEGMTAFGDRTMMRSALTRWLTAGRFMRALFGVMKAVAFVFLCGLQAWVHLDTGGTLIGAAYGQEWFRGIGWAAVWLAVALTVIRAIPVVVDGLALIRTVDARRDPRASRA